MIGNTNIERLLSVLDFITRGNLATARAKHSTSDVRLGRTAAMIPERAVRRRDSAPASYVFLNAELIGRSTICNVVAGLPTSDERRRVQPSRAIDVERTVLPDVRVLLIGKRASWSGVVGTELVASSRLTDDD